MVHYSTKEECLKAIETVKTLGIEPTPWMLEQLEAFLAKEKEIADIKNSKTPIWDTLKINYPYGDMPEEKIKCVEETVDKLLEEGTRAEEPGLLLGKIQCGKTDTFEDIIGLAFDKGIDIAVVITKGTKALVKQTIKRMANDYRFFKATDKLEQRTTINIYDIMDVWRSIKKANVEKSKIVIVCKKESTNLDHLIKMFDKNASFLKNKKVLIVDDEADFASRNYRSVMTAVSNDGNVSTKESVTLMAKISQQIDDFRKTPEFCRYLQVTATPYCLYLQPDGELNLNGNTIKPFKPRFTSLVPIHDKYIGGQQYFVDSQDSNSMYSHLFHQVEQKCIDVLGHEDKRYLNASVSSVNIYGLTYALVSYFMATAIRRIQAAATEKIDYKTSAIIHVEIDKKNHEWQRKVINRLIDSIKSAIVDKDESDQRVWSAINYIYEDFKESNRKGREEGLINIELPSKEDTLEEIRNIFNPDLNNYSVQTVNSDGEVNLLLDEETGELKLETAANIFIGGNILDRGVTIKNMLCFFYGRNPKNFQQDTVLQHARMYGARSKEDMAVMRFHTTAFIYKILVRMNDLDEQLRKWFIEGRDLEEPNAVFVGYDTNIKPCSSQKIKISNAIMLKGKQRVLPSGFWTGTKTAINKTIEKIDNIITTCSNYNKQDKDGIFEMDKDTVVEIVRLIESTFVYNKDHNNMDRQNDIKEMLCALEYCTSKTGKLYVMHRTNRNMNRIRENGCFIDAPHDGRTDLKPAYNKAVDIPLVMFLRQNGQKCIDKTSGVNIGWNGAPFYWPVLITQQNLSPAMYALDQNKQKNSKVTVDVDILKDIDKEDVLSISFKGDLEEHFGTVGKEYNDNDDVFETRSIKETTAGLYLIKDENGEFKINPSVKLDKKNFHGVYSLNNGDFPFILRPYRYILLRNGRNAKANVMLLELTEPEKWLTVPEGELNDDGDLIDRDTNAVLVHGSDTIMDKNMKERAFRDETLTQWIIGYKIKKVLKFCKNNDNLNAAFNDDVD